MICSAQFGNLRNLEIALRNFATPKMCDNLKIALPTLKLHNVCMQSGDCAYVRAHMHVLRPCVKPEVNCIHIYTNKAKRNLFVCLHVCPEWPAMPCMEWLHALGIQG